MLEELRKQMLNNRMDQSQGYPYHRMAVPILKQMVELGEMGEDVDLYKIMESLEWKRVTLILYEINELLGYSLNMCEDPSINRFLEHDVTPQQERIKLIKDGTGFEITAEGSKLIIKDYYSGNGGEQITYEIFANPEEFNVSYVARTSNGKKVSLFEMGEDSWMIEGHFTGGHFTNRMFRVALLVNPAYTSQ